MTTHPILLRITRLPVGRRASGFVLVGNGLPTAGAGSEILNPLPEHRRRPPFPRFPLIDNCFPRCANLDGELLLREPEFPSNAPKPMSVICRHIHGRRR